jgi:hypothetical protein
MRATRDPASARRRHNNRQLWARAHGVRCRTPSLPRPRPAIRSIWCWKRRSTRPRA